MTSEFKKDKEAVVNKIWGFIPLKIRPLILVVIILIEIFLITKPFVSISTSQSSIYEATKVKKGTQIDSPKSGTVNFVKKTTPQMTAKIERLPATQSQTDADFFKQVQITVAHLTSDDARRFVIKAYRNSTHKITISQLSTIGNGMVSEDIRKTVEVIASHILNDGSPETLDMLLAGMTSEDAQVASGVLVNTKKE